MSASPSPPLRAITNTAPLVGDMQSVPDIGQASLQALSGEVSGHSKGSDDRYTIKLYKKGQVVNPSTHYSMICVANLHVLTCHWWLLRDVIFQ
ncbi:hypothetical protein ONZ51_g12552 [Trametes cubensis]|uniref:Uncharacterized protein n=1 Tax=Trametes cubensis TaxID=1111947 RepID=A0AAD7TFS9_9APHY|nr:hypothetical protein ONZ51_g12552 [Trametes cubensis]